MVCSDLNGEFNGTVPELVFVDGMTLPARFQTAFFHAVKLQQSVELSRLSPATFKVVKSNLALFDIEHNWIPPVGETDRVSGGFSAKQGNGFVNGFSQFESAAGQAQCLRVADLRLDGDNM